MGKGVIVDIGTGDGSFVTELAKQHPDRFVIGIDPHHKNLVQKSAQIYKKPQKGGLENALFVVARVEDLPHELDGVANQVFINFPWSGLLRGVVHVEHGTWENIKRICAPGAVVDVVFGYDEQHEAGEMEEYELPELSLEYIQKTMAPQLDALGFTIQKVKELSLEDLKMYPSSWAKRLAFGQGRIYYYVRLRSA